jgi:ADP-heptose:LPS heptosyltransferase
MSTGGEHASPLPRNRRVRIGILSNTSDLGVMVVRNLLIKLVRERYPHAWLVLLAEADVIDSVRRFHQQASWVDACVGIPSERARGQLDRLRVWARLCACRLDMIILSPESKLPHRIPYLCGIPRRVGFSLDAEKRKYLTHPVTLDTAADDRDLHWSAFIPGYARALGLSYDGVAAHVPFMRVPARAGEPSRHRQRAGLSIVVHVGGNPEWNRRWPLQNFLRLCRTLARDPSVSLVLIGTQDETFENRTIVATIVRTNPGARIEDVSGCALEETARHIADADLFVGNDSGPMNIAVALGTPIVAIRGADPENFRADIADARHIVLSGWTRCARYAAGTNICDRGCPVAYERRTQRYPQCMADISFDSVLQAVRRQLQKSRAS